MERLKPLNDFIFKKLFGEKDDEPVLIAFLNAVLNRTQKEKLTQIEIIENKELTKQLIEDKTGRIDVRAKTARGEQIDIEVQLTDQANMDKRTLFYWGKLYLEGIKQGEDYRNLSKVITINLLDFKFLDTKNYHSSFHLWEDQEKDYMLTDLVEIHFIELPKFRSLKDKNYKEEALQRWLTFLEKDVSREILEELMQMEPAIKMAEQKLDFLSSDPKTIELYKAREYAAHEKANLLSTGLERGKIEGKLEVARALLDILDDETIAMKTGLGLEQVKELRSEYEK
ncbi:MAG: Rpn family recombination-promoting nuclease/putative transposase [Cellulosilyticaceae bacterium]